MSSDPTKDERRAKKPHYAPESNLLTALRFAVVAALDERGATQAWLAQRIGITEKHLSHMLTGQAEGSMEVWSCMLTTFGITVLHVPNTTTEVPGHVV